jgi:adenylate cyclase
MDCGLFLMDHLILKLIDRDAAETTFRVSHPNSILGRSPDCHVHLPYSGVSRRHAQLDRDPASQWILTDLGGPNGTWVNGHCISSPCILKDGDLLEIGTITLAVITGPSTATETHSAGPTMLCLSAIDLRSQWLGAALPSAPAIPESVRIRRLTDLVDIAQGLNTAASIDAIFEQVQTSVFRHFRSVDRLALLVDGPSGLELEVVKTASRRGPMPHDPFLNHHWLSRTICQKAYAEKAAIQTADALLDDRFDHAASVVANDIRSAMAVPLWNDSHVVGVLYADAHVPAFQGLSHAADDLGFFSSLANLVAASVQRWRLTSSLQSVELVRRRLERYHSPAVVQKMLSGASSHSGRLLPEERQLTVLFADIVNFTALSEQLSPVAIAALLNRFFEEMLAVLFEQGGTLDKYIGDCIMAFFGAPQDQPDHAQRAASAALAMLDRLNHLNRQNVFSPPFQIRITINTGPAVVGDVGSDARLEYTALGSTINLASRMDGICAPGQCVISQETYAQLTDPGPWSDFGEHLFRGIHRPIHIFSAAPSGA